jgi:type I restriction enzyme S subunit
VAHVVDAPATAVVSTGFAVFRPARIDARFLGYALEETHFVDRVVAASVGVSYPAVNASDIARLPISAPSPDIQRQIADYLDHETAEIDAFIADLGIARAFSQEGLVVQRDRIFGDYAAAASVAELRGKISESDERASATASSADLLTVSIASGVTPRGEWTADQHRADDLTKYKVVRVGDIVLNRMRAFQGAVGVSRNNGITSPDYAVLRCDRRTLLPEFAANLLKSPRFVYEITRRLRGIGNEESGQVRTPRVAVADLIRIPTKVPELEVQQRAVDQWAAEQRLASEVSRDFDAAITLAKERRAALITAAVTGQIDVTTTQTPAVDDIQTAIEESR